MEVLASHSFSGCLFQDEANSSAGPPFDDLRNARGRFGVVFPNPGSKYVPSRRRPTRSNELPLRFKETPESFGHLLMGEKLATFRERPRHVSQLRRIDLPLRNSGRRPPG